ncbi:MAG: RluA family pseudouridine synthase [Oscillospiraceae bacterium]|nr:RluA family pseudouridine synthase [Oscillospiraceae bacterium]MBQ5315338.1 RluA family pseudouridine synthase [Oscillospiraceae bacterium]
MRRIDFNVEPSYDGFTVEKYLMSVKGLSRRLITKIKYSEGIMINGVVSRTVDIIKSRDIVSVIMGDEKCLEENLSLDIPIVYNDDDIVVFNKPYGTPVHPSIRHYNDTLGNYFSAVFKGVSFRPVNRLDKDTSGLCVVAKNAFAAAELQKSVDKTYYAVVKGNPDDEGEINLPIAREDGTIIKRKVDETGQEAITRYKSVRRKNGYTLLEIKLLTGRTHQIRVHFSHIGFALAGDELYGGDMSVIKRHALHCKTLEFIHPVTKEKVVINSEIPDDMAMLFK